MQQNISHPPIPDASAKQFILFRFQLTCDEAREAFLLIIDRRSHASRLIMSGTLLISALVCTGLYGLHPYGLQYALTALLFAFFSFLVCAYPRLKASRSAKAVTRRGGTYELKLSPKGYFILPDGELLKLNGDKRSRTLESDALFAIRPDRFHTVCIPKRAIPESKLESVRNILRSNTSSFRDKTSHGRAQ